MKCYKLTDENHCTKNNTKWGENVTHKIKKTDTEKPLCTEYWLHAYVDPGIAVVMNPVHGNYDNPVLWESEADGEIKHDGQCKFGCTKLKTIRQIPLPEISTEKKVEFAIRCAIKVCKNKKWQKWAENWLSGKNRAANAAYAAYAAYAAASAAAYAASAAEIDLIQILDECGI
jgi:hypothetical protein